MEHRCLNQKQLARNAGLGENAVGYILDGRVDNPAAATLLAVLHALGVNAHWFVTGAEPRFVEESAQSSGTVPAVKLPVDHWMQRNGKRLQVSDAEREFLRLYPWPRDRALPDEVYESALSHYRITQRLIAG
jgi:transcriptional regulator with XRE-family HTH domain